MRLNIKMFITVAAAFMGISAAAQVAKNSCGDSGKTLLTQGWQFTLQTNQSTTTSAQTINLPHDWSIRGDFDVNNPSGTGGGALPGGIGWYEKTIFVDKADKGKALRITFDGAYMNTTVWCNGHELGTRPYGYASFCYDLTPYIKYGKQNVIKVKVDNSDQPNSRWYSGCGIFRNVWLTKTSPVHVRENGTYITATVNHPAKQSCGSCCGMTANVKIATEIVNAKQVPVTVRNTIYDADGEQVATGEADLTVSRPRLWSVESPYLYTAVTELLDKSGTVIDTYTTRFGIREFAFTDKGFTLNGRPMQIQGVCMHHDLGCLGAAINRRAIQRQLEMLKAAGINGIRCSHNPPSPELLDLCDEMGFIVMDESFDMWRKKKTANDYAKHFDQWHETDLHDLIVRDRNHPSILIWSIGNEVLEQWSDVNADTLSLEEANRILNFGHSSDMLASDSKEMSVNSLLTKKLADFVRNLDSTRPITSGCNEPAPGNHLFRSGALDIIGYNYHNQNIPDVPKNFPGKPFIITESNSALMTRGYYRQNSDSTYIWPKRWDIPFTDPSFSCSSYENCHVPWGNTNEETLLLMKHNPWITGQYVWTGFDYIGEPTPYGWPARSSYFGIIDLAGFPKDVYYLYQSELTDTPVLHVFPHWNFGNETYAGEGIEPSRLGDDGMVDVWAYYNQADEVELFLNGKSQGVRSKSKCKAEAQKGFNATCDGEAMHVVWRVKYEPGELLAVARRNGQIVRSQQIKTAGPPAQLRLTPDRRVITADGRDLSFITVEVLDKDGILCPNASNLVNFQVTGNAFIAGVDNGSPISLERFSDNKHRAFYGKCLLVVQNNGEAGTAHITATSAGLRQAGTDIIAQ